MLENHVLGFCFCPHRRRFGPPDSLVDLGRARTAQTGNRPIVATQANYVTSNTCRACHPGNYASWHTSFHRSMTQVATRARMSEWPESGAELCGTVNTFNAAR
jgi:hypothetical protein